MFIWYCVPFEDSYHKASQTGWLDTKVCLIIAAENEWQIKVLMGTWKVQDGSCQPLTLLGLLPRSHAVSVHLLIVFPRGKWAHAKRKRPTLPQHDLIWTNCNCSDPYFQMSHSGELGLTIAAYLFGGDIIHPDQPLMNTRCKCNVVCACLNC